MTRDQAVEEAAREVIAYGGPEALTDPHIALRAIGRALDLGATHRDIENAMKKLRAS
ncbi:hypothetical protein [Streptomyces virginiae]|uniref:hypothetical protein n=1 Tax=Streptomyces virginiae TaxID=1961 RepID=UPI00345D1FBC